MKIKLYKFYYTLLVLYLCKKVNTKLMDLTEELYCFINVTGCQGENLLEF